MLGGVVVQLGPAGVLVWHYLGRLGQCAGMGDGVRWWARVRFPLVSAIVRQT